MRYVFGEFVLEDETRQLWRAGDEVPLGPKAFELLQLLVRSRPRVLSRTRLSQALWPDTHVGPTSLHVLISQVRAALGDDAQDPHWVRTVQRFGYAFRGDVSEKRPAAGSPGQVGPRARLTLGEREWVLQEGENILGRDAGLSVQIESTSVSRHHARIVVEGDCAMLHDLSSKNGTFLSEERVSSPRVLQDGDEIRLGKRVRLVFRKNDDDRTESEVSSG